MNLIPKEFFDLNFRFVTRASEILAKPVDELLLNYTHTFRRFRLGARLNAEHPVWLEYVNGLHLADDPGEYTYQFYRMREAAVGPRVFDHTFGCFSYEIFPQSGVRLHFQNVDQSGCGPLSTIRMPTRIQELRELFTEVYSLNVDPPYVIGGSWLYHLAAYRRLFPQEFSLNPSAGSKEFPYLSLWGQFLDHHFQLKSDLVALFLERLERACTPQDLEDCFPYSVLYTKAPLACFFSFYSIHQ